MASLESFRKDFPPLQKEKAPIYLDNACMSLRPQQVIDKITEYYKEYPACAGRSVHSYSQRVDQEVHDARRKMQKFINAKRSEEIIFLRNTTESINLLSRRMDLGKGDVVLTTDKEHNSNLLPWQIQSKQRGFKHKIIHSSDDNTFSMENFKELLEKEPVKLVAINHTSNLDGVSNPVKEIVKAAHKAGALVALDAAQSLPHKEVDVNNLGVDFLACSGHKMLGPSATGVLYGKKKLLEALDHDNVGGETASDSTYETADWEPLPHKFEAGLQHYAGIIGLGAAVDYLRTVGIKNISHHELELNKIMSDQLLSHKEVSLIGPEDPKLRSGIFSFNIKGLSGHDIATMLSASRNIMIRSGAHCVHSWFNKHGMDGSARASTYFYNTIDEAQAFVDETKELLKLSR